MKIKWITFLICFYCSFSFSQTPASLVADTKKLYTAFDEVDIDGLSHMICGTNNQLTYDILDAYFLNENDKFRNVFSNVKYIYSPTKSINGKTYCTINYRNVIRITYFKPIDIPAVQQKLKEKFTAQSIVYEKARNSFLIVYNAKMTAISETGTSPWLFAFNDNTLPVEISQNCLSDENITKELGIN